MMIIYTIIFGIVFKASEDYFPIFIFTGITMWGFFSRSVNGSVNTVRNGKDICIIFCPYVYSDGSFSLSNHENDFWVCKLDCTKYRLYWRHINNESNSYLRSKRQC